MQIAIDKSSGVTFVALLTESLDASNTGEFKKAVMPAVEPNARVVLDLAAVQFIDSSGLGAILALLRQLTQVTGDLKVCSVTKPVRTLFELVRMHKMLDIFASRDEAAQSYHSR